MAKLELVEEECRRERDAATKMRVLNCQLKMEKKNLLERVKRLNKKLALAESERSVARTNNSRWTSGPSGDIVGARGRGGRGCGRGRRAFVGGYAGAGGR